MSKEFEKQVFTCFFVVEFVSYFCVEIGQTHENENTRNA